MTKTAIVIVAALAGTAFADVSLSDIDRTGYSMFNAQGVALDGTENRGSGTTYYDNQAGPYSAFPPAGAADNPLGVADYQSTAVNNIAVDEFIFVGGVDTIGAVVFFDFFDAGGNFLDGFGVALPSAGDFIWTITPTDLEIAADGLVQMTIDDGTLGPAGLGRWFLNDTPAAVGDAGVVDVPGSSFNYAFSINGSEVPAPGALALVGLGGIVATRRRR
jgi:MYXO-CTERM domain-containing protein